MLTKGFNLLWPTYVWKGRIYNKKLADTVSQHILTNYGEANKVSSNVSGDNLFDDKFFTEFKNDIVKPAFDDYLTINETKLDRLDYDLRAWVTGYGTSYAMPKHNHSGSHLSAVFYLLADEWEENGGKIRLHDPRTNANRGYTTQFGHFFEHMEYQPKSYDILIFPSFLYHNVETFNGKLRLAVPIDLTIYEKRYYSID